MTENGCAVEFTVGSSSDSSLNLRERFPEDAFDLPIVQIGERVEFFVCGSDPLVMRVHTGRRVGRQASECISKDCSKTLSSDVPEIIAK